MIWQTPEVTAVTVIPEVERAWPTYDHDIALDDAKELITRHKRANPAGRSAVACTRVALDRILAQDGCAGVRMYFAMNPDGTPTLVLVGVDEQGNDMDRGPIADQLYPCPPFCPMDSLLDS